MSLTPSGQEIEWVYSTDPETHIRPISNRTIVWLPHFFLTFWHNFLTYNQRVIISYTRCITHNTAIDRYHNENKKLPSCIITEKKIWKIKKWKISGFKIKLSPKSVHCSSFQKVLFREIPQKITHMFPSNHACRPSKNAVKQRHLISRTLYTPTIAEIPDRALDIGCWVQDQIDQYIPPAPVNNQPLHPVQHIQSVLVAEMYQNKLISYICTN